MNPSPRTSSSFVTLFLLGLVLCAWGFTPASSARRSVTTWAAGAANRYEPSSSRFAFFVPTRYDVNSTADGADSNTADGVCNDGAGRCTLRAAIQQSNANFGSDTIGFNIPGAGVVHTITPLSQLPDITDAVFIDGYSQPGASANSNPFPGGSNAVLLIQLSGAGGSAATGLIVKTIGSEIRGLVINRFPDRGVIFETGGGNSVSGCFIGTNAAGTAALPNGGGVLFIDSENNMVGGSTTGAAARNVISGNSGHGVDIFRNSDITNVKGNFIGTNAAGNAALPNGGHGILIHDSAGAVVGGFNASERNVISGNGQNGVVTFTDTVPAINNGIVGNFIGTDAAGVAAIGNGQSGVRLNTSDNRVGITGAANIIAFNNDRGVVVASGTGNLITSNSVYSNVGPGIDLGDSGGNNFQNFPVISSATLNHDLVTVAGSINSTPNTTFNVELFSNASCDPSGHGEGQTFNLRLSVNTDASGNGSFNVRYGPAALGQFITATATSPSNNTSEFSQCRQVVNVSTLTVTNTNDGGAGSLRQTVADAPDNAFINFAPGVGGVITLTSGQLNIGKNLNIVGPGADVLTVSGNNVSRVFNVTAGFVHISGLTVANGFAIGEGGGILNMGILSLDDCVVSNNRSTGYGGGIVSHQTLVITDSTIANNTAIHDGGGIGVFGPLTLINSTISSNTAEDGFGGGIVRFSGTVDILSSTVTLNRALKTSPSTGFGGGLAMFGGAANLRSSIVAGNTAAGNNAGIGEPDIHGTINSQGFNLIGNTNGATINGQKPSDKINVAPLLGPLQNNGGRTPTHALLAGSPALDAGDDSLAGQPHNLTFDQRLFPRPFGAHADIGAFEAQPRNLVVTNTNAAGAGSLRQAILDANANPNFNATNDTISFNIPGAGVHTITPTLPLPAITDPVTIDGYTQPGASPNTLDAGDDARLLIELNGASPGATHGLNVAAGSGSRFKGLVVNRFQQSGIFLQTDDNVVEGCFIGTDPSGTVARANGGNGLTVIREGNVVGGTTPAARNVISGNGNHGVFVSFDVLSTTRGVPVQGNFIGTRADGAGALGNLSYGVLIDDGDFSSVGGVAAGAGNTVAFNGAGGVGILNGVAHAVLSNSIHSNGTTSAHLGIDLNNDGVTLNEPTSNPVRPNRLQRFPVLVTAAVVGPNTTVSGTLNSVGGTSFNIQFFSNASCDPSGHGEGQTLIGSADVTTDAGGNAFIAAGPFAGVAPGQLITATATNNATDDTSEFSRCVQAVAATSVTVTNTDDDGEGSLRQALNGVADGGAIEFGADVRGAITLKSELVINKSVTINGPGANLLTLSGGNVSRLLNISAGGAARISNLSLADGRGAEGGAVLNGGSLTLTNCTVSRSEAAGRGGGVFNSPGGTLNVEGSTVSANTSGQGGGGIYNAGAANVSGSTLSGNSAKLNGGSGGGILNGGTGALDVVNSTFSGNSAGTRGGGIANEGGTLALTACTVYGNSSIGAAGSGGGVSNLSGAASLRGSIVANNFSVIDNDDLSGTFSSKGSNLISAVGNAVLNPPRGVEDLTGTPDKPLDPRLGALQNNGGPTDTHALLQGSPALNAGDDTITLSTDQRGAPRRFGERVDAGAFETRASVSGLVLLGGVNAILEGVTLTLKGDSAGGELVVREAESGPTAVGDGNYTFMDVPEGTYTVTPQELRFKFEPKSLDVSVPGRQLPPFVGLQLVCPTSTIRGRVNGPDGKGLAGVTLTLSGPKTVVLNTPGGFECEQGSDPGSFCFGNVTSGTSYTLTPTLPGVTFVFEEGPASGDASNNGRGGADIPDLGAGCGAPDFELGMNFKTVTAAPTPTPTPSDDFAAETTDPDRFRQGVLSLDTEAFEPSVRVKQVNGQLQITPRRLPPPSDAATAGAKSAAVEEPGQRFNGYVSVRDVNLNSSTSVSVKADQPIKESGAQTVFSVGRDCLNFYRFRVGDASSVLDLCPSLTTGEPPRPAAHARPSAVARADGPPQLFFESALGGQKVSGSVPFDENADIYWRLRFEPRLPGLPPAMCPDVSSPTFILFETSADRVSWRRRFCAPVGRSAAQVAAELLAGTSGFSAEPGTAKFSDYRVADQTTIGFKFGDLSKHVDVDPTLAEQTVIVEAERAGNLDSGALVSYEFDRTGGALQKGVGFFDDTENAGRLVFQPGQAKSNPIRLRLRINNLGADTQKLKLFLKDDPADPRDDAVGGSLDASRLSAVLDIGAGNPIFRPEFFVRRNYLDFLGRQADDPGLNFWMNEITRCGADAQCREVKRINVSAAFFLSIEFQETGYFAHRFYRASYGRNPARSEFVNDVAEVGRGVVVNRDGWQTQLATNKQRFLDAWVAGPAFKAKFDTLNSEQYVDTLYANAGVAISPAARAQLIIGLLTRQKTRAGVLAELVESQQLRRAEFNRAFVLMQYFGYLQRDPDEAGYNFWLSKLEQFGGDFAAAEMVKAFLDSAEYKSRFGTP